MQGKLKLELNNFQFCRSKSGRILRCTLAWLYEDEVTGAKLGWSLDGCLVIRNSEGEIGFHLPMSTFRGGQRRLANITKDLHDTVVDIVNRSKYGPYIGDSLTIGEIQAKHVRNAEDRLPLEMEIDRAIQARKSMPYEYVDIK
jgi:hypothetical protein